jgi:phosphoribosyl-AMP cyclohydrolase / phosphoribosyl-ATP pyrophosphohydrolase
MTPMLDLRWNDQGLIPAVVQHARSGAVLMLGWMNEQALQLTQQSGMVTFWSRSRNELWTKGAGSGNTLRLVELRVDCDADALLVLAEPAGPTCHTGSESCFSRSLAGDEAATAGPPAAILSRLADRIAARAGQPPESSYTAKLLHGGVDRIGKKIGEEAAEVIIAAKNRSAAELSYEMADLLYHSLVLLQEQGLPPEAVFAELARRYAK